MFITKPNRIAVYSYLFQEGTLVAKKDFYWRGLHSEELPVRNLEVLSLMKSFTSKGFCKETYNWQHYYYYLTNEGIEYLRTYLCLPSDIVPATLKAKTSEGDNLGGEFNKTEFSGEGGFGRRGGRDGYRD